ncbi:MAG TPA: ABC transporter permease [Acidimicrobiales bacterium]|nr:ABC transporter permease [Acidimicrobiales bacterium]
MRQILRKLVTLVPTVLLVSALTFFLTSLLPGDPALQVLGSDNPSQEAIEAVRHDLGLDRPLPIRYLSYLGDISHGDFGRSYRTRQPVLEAIRERLPVTLEIGLVSLIVALLAAVPLGVLSAYRANTAVDRGISTASFGLLSVPNFMVALILLYVFAVYLGLFPATGWTRLTDDPVQNLRRVVLPATALGIGSLATYTRLLRSDMIATLQEDFVSMARAKGLPTWRILFRHALRPSSFSLLTLVGLQIGGIVGGAVIVEQFFALPGVGRLLFDSITQRDLVMVQGVVLFLALATVFANFAVDLLYSVLDPRIRRGSSAA